MINPTDLDKGPFDRPDDYGNSPLSLALVAGRFEIAKSLLDSGVTRENIDSLGQGLWHFAAGYRKKGYLELASAYPSDPDLARKDGLRPLHISVTSDNRAAVAALLEKGASPCQRSASGEIPLAFAVSHGRKELVYTLESAFPPDTCRGVDDNTELHYAAASGNAAYLAYLAARGMPVDALNARGETPLLIAVLYEREFAVRFLLSKGADPGHRSAKGLSPKDVAGTRHSPIIRRLITGTG